ncbi:MAG: 4Fe-4S dicluster domain-containing protein [Methanobrevibacter sp.]|jgi:NAD-dependent dihydropyrimidine dehydrogenase PreA subunit|nr:4Fe-4S dicluster domain-containing protein [Candidatus Methanovirga meridionalis]
MVDINLDQDKCKGLECGECVDVCPMEIFQFEGDKVNINHPEDCIICEVCVDICPNQCISVKG